MSTCRIRLNSIETVKSFVEAVKHSECKMEIISGRYIIDAGSIMGIFSLDLTEPLDLRVVTGTLPEEVMPFLA